MDVETLKTRLAERTKQFDQAIGQANFLAGQVRELENMIAEETPKAAEVETLRPNGKAIGEEAPA